MRQGGLKHGFLDDRWTTKRVRQLIGTTCGVWYHADDVGTLLRRLGFSPQRPETRAMERDEAAIRTWVETKSSELTEKMRAGITVVFVDEVGFSLKATVTRTWAITGKTPLIATCASWDKLSTRGALTSGGQFLPMTHAGAIKTPQVIAFLQHVLTHIPDEVVVVLDNASIHKAKAVKAFVEGLPRLSLLFLPPTPPN